MSNLVSRKECAAAQVWWKVTTTGRFDTRLTTPTQQRTFFMRRVSTGAGKATLMVALATHRLGYVPKPCLAKPMLFAALACLDAGDTIGAGVRLREATTRFLIAACDWYGCAPKPVKHPKPGDYIRALRDEKHLDKWGCEIMSECIEAGNKAAHCQSIDRATVKGGISLLFSMMDGEVYAGHERQPLATSYKADCDCGYDDDDEDGSDWWKVGAV